MLAYCATLCLRCSTPLGKAIATRMGEVRHNLKYLEAAAPCLAIRPLIDKLHITETGQYDMLGMGFGCRQWSLSSVEDFFAAMSSGNVQPSEVLPFASCTVHSSGARKFAQRMLHVLVCARKAEDGDVAPVGGVPRQFVMCLVKSAAAPKCLMTIGPESALHRIAEEHTQC
eukprot:4771084-Amphidinium_carterae.2